MAPAVFRNQAVNRLFVHSGERGSQWPAALELLFSEMPMVSVERNIITYSAAISVFPRICWGGVEDWRGYIVGKHTENHRIFLQQ